MQFSDKKTLLSFICVGIFSFSKTKTTTQASRVWGNMNYRGYNKHIKRTCGSCRAASMSAGAQALYVKR